MRDVVVRLLREVEVPFTYEFKFANGASFQNKPGEPILVVRFGRDDCFALWFRKRSIGFGESYMQGDFSLEKGDMQDLIRLGFLVEKKMKKANFFFKLKVALEMYSRRNTISGSLNNISTHYDLGNDFYALWLDSEGMQYTCAYFEKPDDSLEQAQWQKMDLVCRKLRLRPGDRVVEAGCGWGGFALHAAEHYGITIRSYNISKEQVAWARGKARQKGLSDKIEYVLDDYRNIGANKEKYDKFVSVGMLEHVGVENYYKLFSIVRRTLKPEGLALVHSICRTSPRRTDPWLEKYIFPGSYMPSLAEVASAVEQDDFFHIVDVENLRLHYALTLDHWSERFENNIGRVQESYSPEFIRMWRLYLRSAAAAFRYGGLTLLQILCVNGLETEPALTRRHFVARRTAREAGVR